MENLECTPAELQELLSNGNAPRLLDVREEGEWSIVHLEGGQLLTQELINEITESWDKDAHLVCYCHHGVRSMQAVLFLKQQGFANVKSMKGGIDAWAREIDPSMARY